jgi:hypothetical protein
MRLQTLNNGLKEHKLHVTIKRGRNCTHRARLMEVSRRENILILTVEIWNNVPLLFAETDTPGIWAHVYADPFTSELCHNVRDQPVRIPDFFADHIE